jgi:diacylglycerol kinase
MGAFRLLTIPIRRIASSRLFQLGVVIAIVLLLENFSDNHAVLTKIADVLDKVVETTVQLISDHFHNLRTLTKSMLTDGVMIGYVYLVCLVAFALLRWLLSRVLDLTGRTNFLWLRKTIARERGIAAYRAWLPLERIRPADYPQAVWEEEFAWPVGDRPPYPPLGTRMVRGTVGYAAVLAGVAVLLQFFTPFPVLTWLEKLIS